MNVLLTGASGFLGRRISKALEGRAEVTGSYHTRPVRQGSEVPLDVRDKEAVFSLWRRRRFDVCIHASACCSLEACERSPQKAWALNVEGSQNIAEACRRFETRLIYISTDHVFDGEPDPAFGEEDEPRPIQQYGLTKREGEKRALAVPEALSVRFPLLYGNSGPDEKATFVSAVIDLLMRGEAVRADANQVRYPVLVDDAAQLIGQLALQKVAGILHFSGAEGVTKFNWAMKIAEALGGVPSRIVAEPEVSIAARPRNNRLACTRLAALGLPFPRGLEAGLSEVLHQRGRPS
jgi:dTDP-4-dehydrorhamnose reductase